MVIIQSVLLFDCATIVLLMMLAYLSGRLGEALKIPPYYRLLYIAAAAVFIAILLDLFPFPVSTSTSFSISFSIRVCATIGSLFVCLRYWKWLFSEFFKQQG
jgi:uncharacterized membrane protein